MKKLLVLLFLTSCAYKKTIDTSKNLINLLDSVKIIRNIINQNKLSQLLEDHDPEQLEYLMNNFSPAQMALESEVFSTTIHLVVIYYYKESQKEIEFIKLLEKLANENINKVKFVTIEADKLFSLAQNNDINDFPTIVFTKKRKIIDKISKEINIDLIKKKIEDLQVLRPTVIHNNFYILNK